MSSEKPFTKENLDGFLKELAKEFRKRNGAQVPAEIILIGGASILINYGFREMTYDMDAIIQASSAMREAINQVGDKYDLPNGWLNTDFIKTKSYSPKIIQHSEYYKTFSNIVKVRTVSQEYLVAMKLMAGRQYKNDLSDVVGIILEQNNKNKPLTLEMIQNAAIELYGSYEALPESSRMFIEKVLMTPDLKKFYEQCRMDEIENKDILLDFQNEYPDVLAEDNLVNILAAARARRGK